MSLPLIERPCSIRLKSGDRVHYLRTLSEIKSWEKATGETAGPIAREITEVRDTGYTWVYVDRNGGNPHGDADYISENSTDPFFRSSWAWERRS